MREWSECFSPSWKGRVLRTSQRPHCREWWWWSGVSRTGFLPLNWSKQFILAELSCKGFSLRGFCVCLFFIHQNDHELNVRKVRLSVSFCCLWSCSRMAWGQTFTFFIWLILRAWTSGSQTYVTPKKKAFTTVSLSALSWKIGHRMS